MSWPQNVSKYRHVYAQPSKSSFTEIKNPMVSGEGSYVTANSTFFAVGRSGGGGPVYLMRHDNPGRMPGNAPLLSVHKGKCLDMDFHPFIENMIATVSEDCTIALTSFPKEGLTESITEATVVMKGHQKKVLLCSFNPSANGVLATASFDRTVKVWNVETQAAVSTFDGFEDNIYSMEWNLNGSMLATTSKDKTTRIFDPRTSEEVQQTDAFDGVKSSKVFWVPQYNWIGATGFSKIAKRQLKLWDIRNFEKPILSTDLDQASSVLMPNFDTDCGVLYLAGKGDGNITYFKIENDERKLYNLGNYRSTSPQKGGGWVPKKGLDVWKCEVQRFMKLTRNAVTPMSFMVPRKNGTDVFQEDIFPDCLAGTPALTASEWESGENKDPIRMSMNPSKRNDSTETEFTVKKSYAELEKENQSLIEQVETMKSRIQELESQLNITSEEPTTEEESKEDE